MSTVMNKLLFMIITFEGILFLLLYFFGPNGSHLLSELSLQKVKEQEAIVLLERKIDQLQQELKFSQSSFAKEKFARERLLMKKENEKIYFKNSMKDN